MGDTGQPCPLPCGSRAVPTPQPELSLAGLALGQLEDSGLGIEFWGVEWSSLDGWGREAAQGGLNA